MYGNNTHLLDYALSNKLYYSAALYLPIIVSKGTYMEEISVGNGFGFTLDFEDKYIKDKLLEYMLNIDRKCLKENCDTFMKDVFLTNDVFSDKIKNLLND